MEEVHPEKPRALWLNVTLPAEERVVRPYSQPVQSDAGLSPWLVITALAAGMVSFASPCVLPLVPAYLGFITGRSAEELQSAHGRARARIITQGLAFVLGLALIFGLLGASASVLGHTLLQH